MTRSKDISTVEDHSHWNDSIATDKKSENQKSGKDKSESKMKTKSKGHKSNKRSKKTSKKRQKGQLTQISPVIVRMPPANKKFCHTYHLIDGPHLKDSKEISRSPKKISNGIQPVIAWNQKAVLIERTERNSYI